MSDFRSIKPEEIQDNVFRLLNSDWMLITAGTPDSYNMMTASWGGLGVLWHKPVSYIVVRPQRYTYEFLEKSSGYTLSLFEEKYRDALRLCGSKSGRDINKTREAGLTPLANPAGSVFFSEARLVMECRKIYFQDIDPANFLDPEIEKNYSKGDYHRLYVGEILKCQIR